MPFSTLVFLISQTETHGPLPFFAQNSFLPLINLELLLNTNLSPRTEILRRLPLQEGFQLFLDVPCILHR
jgi:hypothetical protein